MSQKSNVKASKKRGGAASPEVGAKTNSYGKSSGYRSVKVSGHDKQGKSKSRY